MDWPYSIVIFLQKMALRLFADWKVEGAENVPPMGPLIIVANHQGNFDPPLLTSSLPRRLYFLAKSNVFRGALASKLLTAYGAFPVNREGGDVRAYRWVLGQLRAGKPVVFFPEGTRSRNGMIRAKPGIAQIALQSQALILPVGITGSERMGSWLRVFNPTGKFRVRIGEVFSIPPIEGKPNKEVLESISDMIMERVAQLLPESYQGVYGLHSKEKGCTATPRH